MQGKDAELKINQQVSLRVRLVNYIGELSADLPS
jgi:hypothetical protein